MSEKTLGAKLHIPIHPSRKMEKNDKCPNCHKWQLNLKRTINEQSQKRKNKSLYLQKTINFIGSKNSKIWNEMPFSLPRAATFKDLIISRACQGNYSLIMPMRAQLSWTEVPGQILKTELTSLKGYSKFIFNTLKKQKTPWLSKTKIKVI